VGVDLAGFAGLAGVTVFVAGQGMDGSGDWAGVLSRVLAGLLALCSLVVWLVRLARRTDDGGPPVADRLRKAVRVQWTAEAAARRLTQPRPLRLTWHPTARPGRRHRRPPVGLAGRRRRDSDGGDQPGRHPVRHR
jgi:hypothetical protein